MTPAWMQHRTIAGIVSSLRNMSLASKLTIPSAVFIAGISLFVYYYLPSLYERQGVRAAVDKTESIVSITAFGVTPAFVFGDTAAFHETIESLRQDPQISFIVFVGADGAVAASYGLVEAERAGFRTARTGSKYSSDGEYLLAYTDIHAQQGHIGELYLGVSLAQLHSGITETKLIVGLASLMFFVSGVVIVFGISTLVTKPLARMVVTAESITNGDFSSRARVESLDEVGHLATAINTMIDRLHSTYQELEANNLTLEERVRHRTAELEREVNVRKQSEAALRESEVFLRNSQKVAQLGSYIFDVESGVWESSHILDTIFGIDAEYGRTIDGLAALLHPDFRKEFDAGYRHAVERRKRFDFKSMIIRRSDGIERWVHWLGEFESDASGRLRMLGTIQDITEGITLERQLLQAQKLEGLGTRAGGIAHDFNNLLSMILGSAELLSIYLHGNPKHQKQLDRIVEASQRGASISRQLLIFSRPEESELKPVSAAHIITELQHMLSHFLPKSIAIETRIDAHDAVVMGDAGQIHQAILNLVLNAADAMSNNGRITFTLKLVDGAVLANRFEHIDARSYTAVSVADTGQGMSEALIAKIFDPFFTTKERGKGTGLGLAMVHGIVKHHKGFIDVTSTPGRGTTFTLFFPAADHAALPASAANETELQNENGTILLVDDEFIIREMLCEYLEECGFTVVTGINGIDGLKKFSEHRADVDLVISDLGMPEMGGEEFLRRLKAIDPAIPVLISSGYLDGISKDNLMKMGALDVLTKPFKFDHIRRIIHTVLVEKHAANGSA